MFALPAIAAAIISGTAVGTIVNTIKNNKLKNLTCGDNQTESHGTCVTCPLGSSINYDGVPTNVKGCNCPYNYGYDTINNRCLICTGTYMPYDYNVIKQSNKSNIKGCGCKNGYYNSTTKACVECPRGTSSLYNGGESSTKGCFCQDGVFWNNTSQTCNDTSCISLTKDIKDNKCVNCPDNSNIVYSGEQTDVGRCACDYNYVFKNSKCEKCPDNTYANNGFCCPSGSGLYGPGEKIADNCFCMPMYSKKDNKCVFTTDVNYYSNDINVSTIFNLSSGTPDANRSILFSTAAQNAIVSFTNPTSTGVTGISNIGLDFNNFPGLFIKQLELDYTLPNDTNIYKYYSYRIYNAISNDASNNIKFDIINKTWNIKRLILYIGFFQTIPSATFIKDNIKISIILYKDADFATLNLGKTCTINIFDDSNNLYNSMTSNNKPIGLLVNLS